MAIQTSPILLGFRSAWNLAIAEFMSDKPLEVKQKKIRFDKSIVVRSLGWDVKVKLYKFVEEPTQGVLKVPQRLSSRLRRTVLRVQLRACRMSLGRNEKELHLCY